MRRIAVGDAIVRTVRMNYTIGMTFYELEPEENTFTSLVVDLTHRCNMKCNNCYIPNREIPDMDVNRLYSVLDRLPVKTFIRLIGAEPTLRQDLPEIVAEVVRRGHRPSVTTNGLKLADENLVIHLKEMGLRYVYISMNGADVDEYYQALDNGPYARLKVLALRNLLKHNFFVAIGCIVARGVNEEVIPRTISMIEEIGLEFGLKFNPRYLPTVRFKSIGEVGRHMIDHKYRFDELIELVCRKLDIPRKSFEPCAAGTNTPVSWQRRHSSRWIKNGQMESLMTDFPTRLGPVNIRLVNWDADDSGVINSDNRNRGRLTQSFKIAPFFEHVQENEFGY